MRAGQVHPLVAGAAWLWRNAPVPPGQAIGIVVGVLLDRVRPLPMPGSRALHRVAGTAMLAGGVGLISWALAERRRHTAGAFDLERPESLVTTGPYAFSRHPMYVGVWLVHLGVGVLRGSGWVAVTFPVATLAEHGGVLGEERGLAREFGDEFDRYRERVPRYVEWPGWRMPLATS